MTKLAASSTMIDSMGTWWQTAYEVPDNLILLLKAEQNVAMQGAGRISRVARMVMRVRANGPLTQVRLRRIQNELANASFEATIQGRMDVISIREAVALGVDLGPMGTLNEYTPSRRSGVLDVATLSEQIAAMPRTVTETVIADGKSVSVAVPARGRRVEL
jgi:hypothetical protein